VFLSCLGHVSPMARINPPHSTHSRSLIHWTDEHPRRLRTNHTEPSFLHGWKEWRKVKPRRARMVTYASTRLFLTCLLFPLLHFHFRFCLRSFQPPWISTPSSSITHSHWIGLHNMWKFHLIYHRRPRPDIIRERDRQL